MKFIKSHLVALVCGLVVILALAWWFFWVGDRKDTLQKAMTDRLAKAKEIANVGKQTIDIPGTQPFQGVITTNIIDVKTGVQKSMHDYADQIASLASDSNETGRVVRRDDMGHLVKKKVSANLLMPDKKGAVVVKDTSTVIPLLDGNEEPHYLPVVANGTDPNDFYDHYAATFNRWLCLVVTGTTTPRADYGVTYRGAPPTKDEVDKAWVEEEHRQLVASGGIAALQQGPKQDDFVRNYVCTQASKIRVYATRDSFQKRSSTKNEQEIFDALVDCWLQAEVVHTIDKVNTDAYKAQALPPEEQNVGHSPIKKLDHIGVGFNQPGSTGGGGLFAPIHTALDYTQSMTGRAGTTKYDVTVMQISMDMDPSYINKFIDALYRQNNSYTVLNVKVSTVDPLVAASYGYIYGKQQVVSVSMQVEANLYRGWTAAIMPAVYKNRRHHKNLYWCYTWMPMTDGM